MRILIVEDDPGISSGRLTCLQLAGYAADVCDTMAHARTALRVEPFDAMLLDRTATVWLCARACAPPGVTPAGNCRALTLRC